MSKRTDDSGGESTGKQPLIKTQDPYMTLKEVCRALNIAEGTVRALADRAELKHVVDANGVRRYDRKSVAREAVKRRLERDNDRYDAGQKRFAEQMRKARES